MSKETIDLHFGKLAHGYAERYNKGEGDPEFNYAGAFLHNTYFPQFREVRNNNEPNGPIAGFIKKHFGNYEAFQKELQTEAMTTSIQLGRYEIAIDALAEHDSAAAQKIIDELKDIE
jgi:superoxide dismutase